jgi:hypothetical protein
VGLTDYDFWVDFNNMHGGNTTTTLLAFSPMPTSVGDTGEAGDSDGNHCPAKVIGIFDEVVTLRLNMDRFTAAEVDS